MSQMEINSVLAQIRSLSAQTKVGTSQAPQTQQTGPSEFANILRQGLDSVNQAQSKA
jgi:flagellar hook-basal body complex protein FliE